MFDIESELKKLPQTPGVYMHKNALGEIIYVGKAINLRSRVRQYFRNSNMTNSKIKAMVKNIAEFEYMSCATEMEALVLECNLIKKYKPKYNILMKDDKTYPYIKVTKAEEFPRVIKTRQIERDGGRYFGPYSDASAAEKVVRLINEIYPLKKCRALTFSEGVRPCLNYHIGRCRGVCIGGISHEEYAKMMDEIVDILAGRNKRLIEDAKKRMYEESQELNYEEAAKYREYIKAIEALNAMQRATMTNGGDIDILVPVITNQNSIVVRYNVRDGRLSGREINYMKLPVCSLENSEEYKSRELLTAFITQFYTEADVIPYEIIPSVSPDDIDIITELLCEISESRKKERGAKGHKIKIYIPERGDKRALLDMALTDTAELVKSIDYKAELEDERKQELKDRITALIEKASEIAGQIPCTIDRDSDAEYRIEAYDISNMNGVDTVGAMVVYEGRKPVRSAYRKFKIKTAAAGDDYACLQEVIYRRLKRAKAGDPGFNKYPDIMFIDGGIGQVNSVKKVVDAFDIAIPVVGLAKDDSHRTRAVVFEDGSEQKLSGDRLLFSYAGNIQEEVHRFAITFHRGTRGKKMVRSVLEEIPNIGEKRRRGLMEHFRSIDNIKSASYDEIMEVSGMTSKAAENVIEFFSEKSNRFERKV